MDALLSSFDAFDEQGKKFIVGVISLFIDSIVLVSQTLLKHNNWRSMDPRTVSFCIQYVIHGKFGKLMSRALQILSDEEVFPLKDPELQPFLDLLTLKVENETREPANLDPSANLEHTLYQGSLMIPYEPYFSTMVNQRFCTCTTCKKVIDRERVIPEPSVHHLVTVVVRAVEHVLTHCK